MPASTVSFSAFAQACFSACANLTAPVYTQTFDFAACRLQIQFVGEVPVSFFTDAIAHRAVNDQANLSISDLTVWVADRHNSALQLPAPFWSWGELGQHGTIPGIDPQQGYASYQQVGNVFTLLDRANNRALIWADNLTDLPEWERSFPFRTLLHQWLEPTPWVLVHAGGVGDPTSGLLLTGKGGAGKSTATLACLDGGLGYAGDDFVLIDTTTGLVHCLYNVAKLEADNLSRFPHWASQVANRDSMPAQKGQLFVYQHRPQQVLNQFLLRAIALPHFGGTTGTTYRPATSAEALLALAPSTMALLGAGPTTFRKLTQLVEQYPLYWLETGTDLPQIPAAVRGILSQLNPKPMPDAKPQTDTSKAAPQPLVSVIMPVYNAERFVGDAIRSVLNGQYPNVEIICVDDGSTDSSAQIVQAFGPVVRYVYQENRGPAAARNRAFELVRGEFVTFLDNDDLYPDYKLSKQLATFAAEPDLDVVFGKTQYVFLDGSNPERFHFPDESRTVWNILMGAGLFRTSVFRRIGLFNEELRIGEDGDWYNRAREQGVRIRSTDEVMLYYRHHDANYTRDEELVKSTLLKAIKYSLDRRRSGQTVQALPHFSQFQQETPPAETQSPS
ncbi:glycosyltransferase [Rudanella paleaurantiibacter]|uniref:Glycosyltransferase n=1 Tax=Rudanella paleaurantiibacter TaxID=2614655 RepID=A0A7J5U4A0_9BACT|nr:glycosyltransferase [Rudanella paleaurantiibacter]KAB7732668.1 glycosyltransferase [Rudanella paleaurantiibacter]